ncbi:hypothetical protein PRBEI_2001030000 [Prionailurus iriomotensis]
MIFGGSKRHDQEDEIPKRSSVILEEKHPRESLQMVAITGGCFSGR